MRLQEYESAEEKKKVFADYKMINTPKEFEVLCEESEKNESKTKERYVFRGVSGARYKLFSSAQRFYIERDLSHTGLQYGDLVCGLIREMRSKDNLFCCYMNRLGVVMNDWLVLSYLQHHESISPLIDFSKKFKTALYFAYYASRLRQGDNDKLSNYVSLYSYKGVDAAQFAPNIVSLAKKKAIRFRTYKGTKFWNFFSYNEMQKENKKLFIIPTYNSSSCIKNKDKKLVSIFTIANMNSTAQDGEFVCNMDGSKPLEELFKDNNRKYLSCADIHKGLFERVLAYLDIPSIEAGKHKYFPDEHSVSIDTLNKVMTNYK